MTGGRPGDIRYRSIVAERFGGPEVLASVEEVLPPPPPGRLRVRVLAVGVGYTDAMARTGDYLLQRKAPFVPGYELVGEVIDDHPRTGEDSDAAAPLPPGTRVAMMLPRMGAYREVVSVPRWLAVPVPDGLDAVAAATLPLDYLTALSLLETHGRLAEGDTVLVHGASGGVGEAVGRLGRRMGLRMYGTASTQRGAHRLARNEVHLIDYRTEDFEQVLREREPGGVQAVFDHIGGAYLPKGFRSLAPGGVLVSYAFSGRPGRVRADSLRGAARLALLGMRPGRRTAMCTVPGQMRSDHGWYRASLGRVLELAVTGEIEAKAGTVFPLNLAAEAHQALERRENPGKIVLTPPAT